MRAATPSHCATIMLALAIAGATPARAYVPEDAPLEGAAEPALPRIPGDAPPEGIEVDPADPAAGGIEGEEFGPDDHSIEVDATSVPEPRAGLADITYDHKDLPEPVAQARANLLEAARTGDIEALRPIFARQRVPPIVDAYDMSGDVIDNLRLQSGDAEGREVLAILTEILETGHVLIGEKSTATYVWALFRRGAAQRADPAALC